MKTLDVTAIVLVAGLLLSSAGPAVAQVAQDEEAVDYSKMSRGRSQYRAWCQSCHGDSATGDGPIAEHLQAKPGNLTLLSRKAGGRFDVVRVKARIERHEKVKGHGSKDMPIWGEAFAVVDEAGGEEAVREKIDAIAHYLRSIQSTPGDDS